MNATDNNDIEPHQKKGFGNQFWRFHLVFWCITFVIMFLAGLSQFKTLEVALVRNISYGILGFVSTLLLIPLFDQSRLQSTQKLLLTTLLSAYTIGTAVSLLVNPIAFAMRGLLVWELPWPRWFSGSLNFSLVILVWCGLYLAFKMGLKFVKGDEAQKAAEAISSITSVSTYPEFIALERNKKIVLLPVASITVIQGAGDYVEISTDDGTFLKRDSLSNMNRTLDPQLFQRVHRSTIVNLHAIKELDPKGKGDFTLILKSGTKIASSRSYMKDFKSRFAGIK
ncbi:LytR/AlgR family response regulator transcription factor [Kordiimonas laminariae]|uniref:LytR/AlgR family response regulator transcription factor n=1 Tax=Kordiimonas laminariae TaxID=2917717 RepID=UPI001FF4493B|nr:LytTR family transcriptional regulator [Kordiimonas laminariae]